MIIMLPTRYCKTTSIRLVVTKIQVTSSLTTFGRATQKFAVLMTAD